MLNVVGIQVVKSEKGKGNPYIVLNCEDAEDDNFAAFKFLFKGTSAIYAKYYKALRNSSDDSWKEGYAPKDKFDVDKFKELPAGTPENLIKREGIIACAAPEPGRYLRKASNGKENYEVTSVQVVCMGTAERRLSPKSALAEYLATQVQTGKVIDRNNNSVVTESE